jgi:hypothetical protein
MKLIINFLIFIFFTNCQGNKNAITKTKLTANDSIVKKIDTITGYVIEFDYNTKTKKRDGQFKSYYYEKKQKTSLACEAFYKNGVLFDYCILFGVNNRIITKYENIIYDKKKKKFFAKIFVFNENEKLKVEGYVSTNDEIDFTPIYNTDSYSLEKIRLNEWKYYND